MMLIPVIVITAMLFASGLYEAANEPKVNASPTPLAPVEVQNDPNPRAS